MKLCDSLEFQKLKEEKKKLVQDLINGVQHKKGCHCELCLWREEKKEKRPGRPYDFLTFVIPDLIHDLKILKLAHEGKAKKVKRNGKEVWTGFFKDLLKISDKDVLEPLEKMLEDLGIPEFDYYDYLTHKRYKRVLKKLDEVDSRITERNEKKKRGRPKKSPLVLWKEMKDFIESEGPVSKREIQYKFHLNGKEFKSHIDFLKKFSKLKTKIGKRKDQILYFY